MADYSNWTDAELEKIANKPSEAKPQESSAGFFSLFKKAGASLMDYNKRAENALLTGKGLAPGDPGPSLDWASLEPEEKRAAIAFASMALPGGAVKSLVAKTGVTGVLKPLFTALGFGAEGAAIGGGVQAAGNLATGEPITKDVAHAAKIGAATNVLFGVAGAQSPVVSEEAKNLINRGIAPTVGQAVDKGNIAGRVIGRTEESLGSFPILGEIARNARSRGEQEWRNATLNKVNPIGKPPLSGRTQDRIGQVSEALGKRFDDAAAAVDMPIGSTEFKDWITTIVSSVNDPNKALMDKTKKDILSYLSTRLNAAVQAGTTGRYIPGSILKGIESDIGKWQQAEKRASWGAGRDAFESGKSAMALGEVKYGLRNAREKLSPYAAAIYKDINPKYGNYKAIEKAATSAAGDIGDFTPMQLLAALKQRESPKNFVSGGKPGSFLNDTYQARQVFRNDLPTSGTSERLLPWLIFGGGLGGAYGQTDLPLSSYAKYLAAIPLLAAGGSRMGQQSALKSLMAAEKIGTPLSRLGVAEAGNISDDW